MELPREAQVYVDAKTYVYLEIELYRPLIPKRPASVLAQRYSVCVCVCFAVVSVTHICGAYPLVPFSEVDILNKVQI